ncbi:RagB/SusD family nutrient uptake outer membrane protein [Sphingobacterium sp. SGR-19]|uniref:RagB/SusD family nutrient uptake outer membrane protein n=1 Tax=Sphingobacterium sp. SGR-19 TaxID=2710886 RepID=UPI0013EB242D|nr:RagB/SusD family nutrient uptake outer membrane protein [Sphingobacterium sp. SGR-19]NGM66576.1 RagB/SusD family nutrient uptake outer membrane protein [Sphingobacterium sp. SGR-19]
MKKIRYSLFFLSLTCISIASSCNNLLDEDIRSQTADSYANTPAGFESVVNASYSHMRTFYGAERGSALTVFGTDEFTHGSDGGLKSMNMYDGGLSPRLGAVRETWDNMYIAINNCNMAISRAEMVEGLDENTKTTRVAEVRYLRAFYYFLLVQTWGPVHINLEETQGVVLEARRSPVEDVYQVIVDDLNFAIENLPTKQTDYGRATKGAAEFLSAKVYLTRATSGAAENDDYSTAVQFAKNVIENYDYELLENYADIFAIGPGEINNEVVWAVQYSPDILTAGDGNKNHLYFLMEYDILPGMQRDIENGRPFKRYRPTNFVINELFDKEADTRYKDSFKWVFYCNKPGTYTIRGQEITLNVGDTAIYMSDRNLTPEELAKRKYTVFTPATFDERRFLTLSKFLDPTRVDVSTERGHRDFLVFRLSEAYLIAAEGLLMSGRATEAVPYINTIRQRAAIEGMESQMEISVSDLDIDFILDERARELLGEHVRWFDLVRTGKLVERVKKYNPQGATGIQEYHKLRPIPGQQIDRTEGGQEAFPQNPGYEQ